jgi:2,5-diketo-D-gluconate reductase A
MMPKLSFNDGHSIPQLGFGVWQVEDAIAADIVNTAFQTGYRSIDTASIYQNETGVGQAIAKSAIPRSEMFITTKVFNPDQGFDKTLRAFEASRLRLGLDYLDLYLIHWPAPRQNLYGESWKALIRLQQEGFIKSIGVSNFQVDHLQRIIDDTGVVPVINQIELHPKFQQHDLIAFHQKHGIVTEAWSPLGQGSLLQDPTLQQIAQKHRKTVAQVILRWHMDQQHVAIPKSVTSSRIAENIAIFDFTLDDDDHRAITSLDHANGRIGPHPDTADF